MAASVPFMITRDMRQQLFDLGFPKDTIANMTPAQANEFIKANKKYVKPDKVEREVTKSKYVDTKTQNTLVKEEQKRVRQKNYRRQDQKTVRKGFSKKSRPVDDVNLDKIVLNSQTVQGQLDKAARQKKLLERNWNELTKKEKRQRKGIKAMVRSEKRKARFAQQRIDYIKMPTRNIFDDAGSFFGDIRDTLKNYFTSKGIPDKLAKASKNPWVKRSAKLAIFTIGLNLASSFIRNSFTPPRVIPEEYDRGYDNIRQNLTDFGSPLKLYKAAHKVMRPYHSMVRSALRTNVNTVINHNFSLIAHKNAIGHTRY